MHAPESKFLQFHTVFGKILQNHKLAPPKSWRPHLREILDPPLPPPQRNPGSATAIPWIPCPLDTLPPQIPYPQYPTLQKGHETRDTLPYPPEGTWDWRYPTPPPHPVNRLTDACENIILQQQQLNLMTSLLQLRMVGMKQKNLDLPLAP